MKSLYRKAFKLDVDWQQLLDPKVYDYHQLFFKGFNCPISLQLGAWLATVGAICGPQTKVEWCGRPAPLIMFTMAVAYKGSGKSTAVQHYINNPVSAVARISRRNFGIEGFTHAGIQQALKVMRYNCRGIFMKIQNL